MNDAAVVVGQKRYLRDGDGPYHVVALFEDDGVGYVVLKVWARRKQHWFYSVVSSDNVIRFYKER